MDKKRQALTATIRKSGFGSLLTWKIIFEKQFFAGSLVVKIPSCG